MEEAVIVKRLIRRAGICALLAYALAMTGCMQTYPQASSQIQQAAEAPYLIGPGDTLNINVWRNPELSMTVPVRPDGKLSTPLVEDLPATGKTASQLARDIEKELAKYIQNPVVTVVITSFVGPYSQQIRVIGEASKPQALSYRANMTLLDVMIAVGGITDFAAGNKASILRRAGTQSEQFGVRLQDLIRAGDLTANVMMHPGDVVVIPQSIF
jgi:polysaccharide export outer membrane protein